jgi:hypothetical protein
VNQSVYDELINESSNTNYSIDEENEEDANLFEYIIQIKSICLNSLAKSGITLVHAKVFLRPGDRNNSDQEGGVSYKLADLVSAYDSDALEIFDIDSLKFKCCISIDELN